MSTMQASLPAKAFDYSTTIFGDEPAIDIGARRWGSLRMRRCLTSLERVVGSVLEVGCGAGRVLSTIHRYRPDLKLFGCDISSPAIARAALAVPSASLTECEATDLKYGDSAFDAVVVMDLLEHVADAGAVLSEISRVLKPGGILHLHVPCEGELGSLYKYWLRRGIDMTAEAVGHVHHFRRSEVRALLIDAGFRVAKTWNSMYPLGQLHDMIGWKSRIHSARKLNPTPRTAIEASHAQAVRRNSCNSRLNCRAAGWKMLSALSPRVLYWETRLLGWQPLGSIGWCVSARKAGK